MERKPEKKPGHKFLWFCATLVVTIIFVTIYMGSRQIMLQDGNDPQIQLAEDAATALNAGVAPSDVVNGKVDINTSLAPFLLIYAKSGTVVAGNGYLDGTLTDSAPFSTIENSANAPYTSVAWSPYSDINIAGISVAANNYYVFSGRSLAQVEMRTKLMLKISALGWACSVFVILLAYIYTSIKSHNRDKIKKPKRQKHQKTHVKEPEVPEHHTQHTEPIQTQTPELPQINQASEHHAQPVHSHQISVKHEQQPAEIQQTPEVELQAQPYIKVMVQDGNEIVS